MTDTNKPQKEQSGEIEVHVTASPVLEPDEDATEDDTRRLIRSIVREELATIGLSEKAGRPGTPGESIKGEPGEDGTDGTDGTDAYVVAGAGLGKSGNTLSADLETAGAADGGLELNDAAGEDDKKVRAKISETYGLKLTANGIELKFDPNQFVIDETNGLQLKLKTGALLQFDGSDGLETTLYKCE